MGTNLPKPSLLQVMGDGDRGPHKDIFLTISIGVGMGAYSSGTTSRSTL